MTRVHLLLTVACVTGAAAKFAPSSAPKAQAISPAAAVPARAVTAAPATAQPNVAWLARYGVYNAKQGSWTFIPAANAADGC